MGYVLIDGSNGGNKVLDFRISPTHVPDTTVLDRSSMRVSLRLLRELHPIVHGRLIKRMAQLRLAKEMGCQDENYHEICDLLIAVTLAEIDRRENPNHKNEREPGTDVS
jgi:hypothetical protein